MIAGIPPQKLVAMKKAVSGVVKQISITRLYTGDENGWNFEAVGCLFLGSDKTTEAPYLTLVDTKTHEAIWKQELYKEVKLQKTGKYFISFEGRKCFFGLSFAEQMDVGQFIQSAEGMIKAYGNSKAAKKNSKKSKSKKKGGFFKKIGNLFKGKEEERPKVVISGPTNFSHSMHIGVVPGKGFVTENLPDSWRKIFEEAGVTDEELQDPEKAGKLMSALTTFQAQKDKKKKGKPKKKLPKKKKKKSDDGDGPELDEDAPPPPDFGDDMPDFGSPQQVKPKVGGGNVFDEIKSFKKQNLSKASERKVEFNPDELDAEEKGNLMALLKNSIQGRFESMRGDDDESDDDEDWGSDDAEEEAW